jgi:Fe-S cluster assembly protein SufD
MSARPSAALTRLAEAVGATLQPSAQQALTRLLALGLPTPRDDAFRYTNFRLLDRRHLAPTAGAAAVVPSDLPVRAQRLVLVNGQVDDAASCLDPVIRMERTAPVSNGLGDEATDRIRLLNAALAAEQCHLVIPRGKSVAFDLVVITTDGGAYPSLRLTLEDGASLDLCEYQVGSADGVESLTSLVLDLHLAAGSRVTHTLYQAAGNRSVTVGDVRATVGRDARYEHRSAVLGAQLSRIDLTVHLAERGASTKLTGLFLADDTREHHLRTLVCHAAPDATSEQRYRGVANDRGRGSYDGKILVDAGANGTQSSQSSRNLLLSADAAIETRPQLEINADAVKCSHGTTTGSLDERMMFYLLSRGLDRETARAVLTYAFLGDVLTDFPVDLRATVEQRALGRLPSGDLIRDFVA